MAPTMTGRVGGLLAVLDDFVLMFFVVMHPIMLRFLEIPLMTAQLVGKAAPPHIRKIRSSVALGF